MKKNIIVATSFCALLSLSLLTPKFFWKDNSSNGRFPSSEELIKTEKALSEIKKIDEKIDEISVVVIEQKTPEIPVVVIEKKTAEISVVVVEKKTAEIPVVVVEEKAEKDAEAQVSCLKEKQPTAIEEEIKKLMADKEVILKEIEVLKNKKTDSTKTLTSSDNEETSKNSKKSNNKEMMKLVSQMTSMMISQQEQQQMLMQQMFTMMNQMQMQSYSQQSHNFMGPMNFHTPRTGRSNYYPQSPYFGDLAPGIGIGYPTQSLATYENPYATYSRSPSAKLDTGLAYKDMFIQPQFHSEFPTGNMGLNFSTSDSSSEMERMYY